jgi:hypothetical protein
MASCGLYFLLYMFLNGYLVALERLLAEPESSSSFCTEVVSRNFGVELLPCQCRCHAGF